MKLCCDGKRYKALTLFYCLKGVINVFFFIKNAHRVNYLKAVEIVSANNIKAIVLIKQPSQLDHIFIGELSN